MCLYKYRFCDLNVIRKQTKGQIVWNTPIVPARNREQAETALPSDEKSPR
jgi:hypothetical protein